MDLVSKVKNIVEGIHPLLDIFNELASVVDKPGGLIAALLLFVLLLIKVFNYSKLIETLERKERRRIEQINEYLSQPEQGDPKTLAAVKDQRDAHYFRVATGLYAEGATRNAYIEIHNNLSHSISWKQIIRARYYLEIAEDLSITVRNLNKWETVGYWYNHIACALFTLMTGMLVLIFGLSENKASTSALFSLGNALIFALFAIFAFSQNWPVYEKKNIEKELAALRQQSDEEKLETA